MYRIAGKEAVQSVRDKFQFLGVLTLFFPVTLQAVFSTFQQEVEANYNIMSWGMVVAIMVLSYLAIEYLKDKMPTLVARYSEILLTLSILLYVPIFVVFSMYKLSIIPIFYVVSLGIGIIGTMLIPLLVFMILSATIAAHFLREEIEGIYGFVIKKSSKEGKSV